MLNTSNDQRKLLPNFEQLFATTAQAPGGVARLRELILTLAVQGKLVPQDPSDEPASELLKKIRAEKELLIAEGKIKKEKPLAAITEEEKPFELPVGWEWVRLGELLERLSNGYTGAQSKNPTKYPLTRIETISHSVVDFNKVGFCQDIIESDVEKFKLFKGDILLSHINSDVHLGKTAIYESDELLIHGVNLLLLRPSKLINSNYLNIFINQQRFSGYFLSIAQHAIGQASINQAKLRVVVTALPPFAEQSRIVARVEALMRLCDALEEKGRLEHTQHQQLLQAMLDSLTQTTDAQELARHWQRLAQHFDLLIDRPEAVDALEQTILQLAVRGLLVPQDPSDEPASELLKKIRAEKDRLIAEGKIKKDKPLPVIGENEKPFELPVGWEWARINDLIRIGSGDGLTAAQMTPGGVIPVFGGNGINGYHDQANVFEPTLVIGRVGYYCGSIHITPAQAWVTDNAFITRYPKDYLDMKWLYWLLRGTDLKENDSATAQPVISGRKLYPIVVALPPLAEQSRIVARVTELRALCQQLRDKLAQARTTQTQLAQAWVEQVAG